MTNKRTLRMKHGADFFEPDAYGIFAPCPEQSIGPKPTWHLTCANVVIALLALLAHAA